MLKRIAHIHPCPPRLLFNNTHTPPRPNLRQPRLGLLTNTHSRIQRFQVLVARQTQRRETEVTVVDIGQVACEFAEAAEGVMGCSFQKPAAERVAGWEGGVM